MTPENYNLQTCYHCGNKGLMEIKGKCSQKEYYDYSYNGAPIGSLASCIDWYLLECQVCHMPSIFEEYSDQSMPDGDGGRVVYPKSCCDDHMIPDDIRKAFDSAVKNKGIEPAICLLSLRRTLEMICKNEEASKETLEVQIAHLVKNKNLPPMLEDICTITRRAGNDGAHGDKITLSSYEIDQLIQYVATTINYLYSMPNEIALLKKKIEAK